MTKRVYGSRYNEALRTKEVAEIIRKEIRLEATLGVLPKGKWSVTSEYNSISVSFAPLPAEDELFARAYWNRDRVIDDVEGRHVRHMSTLASEFGLALRERIEQKLGDFNHDGSDLMTDYFDVKFYTTVSISPRTDRPDMMNLYRAGEWPEKKLEELNVLWASMLRIWQKEAAERKAQRETEKRAEEEVERKALAAEQPAIKVGDTLQLEGKPPLKVLRVFPPAEEPPKLRLIQGGSPEPSPEPLALGMTVAALAKAAGVSEAEVEAVVAKYNEASPMIGELRQLVAANTRARRASIAVPVVEPVPQAPNEAWLKLAMAHDLQLDWAIPGLGERS